MKAKELTNYQSWRIANRNQLSNAYQELITSGAYYGIPFSEFCARSYVASQPFDFLTEEVLNSLITDVIRINIQIEQQKVKMRSSQLKDYYAESILLSRRLVYHYRAVINNAINTY